MTATVLMALTSLLIGTGADPLATVGPADPPVRLWLDPSSGFRRGDRVRVDARAEVDGYLLVVHADPSGRIRVLFPLDPFEDSFVRGRRRFELRGRGERREAFTIYESNGVGTVLAAWSPDPFNFSDFARGDHWDYTLASTWDAGSDPETYLVGLAQRVVTSPQFDYDVAQYDVGSPVAYGSGRHYRLGYYHDSYYDRWSFSIGWGRPWGYWAYRPAYWYRWGYDPYYYYDPFHYGDWWGPYSPYPYCVGWCSWRSYYGYYGPRYWGYPGTVIYNTYYRSIPSTRLTSGGYTFKLNGQPRLVAEPRQRAPLATALGRRLSADPVNVITARRTEQAEPARRLLGDRTVRPAIGGGTAGQRVGDQRRVEVRDRATVTTGRTPEREAARPTAVPGRVTTRDRAVVPADQTRPEPRRVDPRDRVITTERTGERAGGTTAEPRRVDPRDRALTTERTAEREGGGAAEPRRAEPRQGVERPQAQPRLEPRRAPSPPREPSAQPSRPTRSAQPRGSAPTVRSAPSRGSGGGSGRSAGPSSGGRSSPPARSGGSSGGRRGG